MSLPYENMQTHGTKTSLCTIRPSGNKPNNSNEHFVNGEQSCGTILEPLFLLVPILGVAVFALAMAGSPGRFENHWFPEDISEHGHRHRRTCSTSSCT